MVKGLVARGVGEVGALDEGRKKGTTLSEKGREGRWCKLARESSSRFLRRTWVLGGIPGWVMNASGGGKLEGGCFEGLEFRINE
jgi:hypothetical protein